MTEILQKRGRKSKETVRADPKAAEPDPLLVDAKAAGPELLLPLRTETPTLLKVCERRAESTANVLFVLVSSAQHAHVPICMEDVLAECAISLRNGMGVVGKTFGGMRLTICRRIGYTAFVALVVFFA